MQFDEAYAKLNSAQKEAVDTIDGPVMVVAGPGTGKTQVLSLRIANILIKTDTPASALLCLTFTNAGVRAMRERLTRLIGSRAGEVHVSTFHRFAITLTEKHYALLDMDAPPVLISDTEAVALVDEILEKKTWQHIRPRGDSGRYFGDLKSLVSLMKREGIAPEDFSLEIQQEIETLRTDPENISSRGARKGELKREVEKRIEGLERTKEVVAFYEAYEATKKARGLMDYDDVLSFAVRLVEESEEVCAELRENYLYVHVDEHQDSSGVQNAFLEAVWGDVEQPNIFVVGDDRQLIYGFGGASLEHFTRFREMFGRAREITLIDNYRSTQTILDAADALLTSSIATGKLKSTQGKKEEKIHIFECDYPRDELLYIARDIQKKLTDGLSPKEIAVLVPKNYQARNAAEILRDQGIPVSASGVQSFFALPETKTLRNILGVLADPYNGSLLGALLLDPRMHIPPLEAHHFIRAADTRKLSLESFFTYKMSGPIAALADRMRGWLDASSQLGLYGLVQKIGEDIFFAEPDNHDALVREVEIVRTVIHLLSAESERNPHLSLQEFVAYLDRLEHYGHEIPLAVFSGSEGVQVLTHFGAKGLEFSAVYIAHLDENSLMKGKRMGFTLPERFSPLLEAKNELAARRELYVAITRARIYCALSYSRRSYTGGELLPARILADIPDDLVIRKNISETEGEMLAADHKIYLSGNKQPGLASKEELAKIVAEEYPSTNVSVTLLNNFYECPWKWYFRSMLKLPEPKTESLVLGSAVHAGIEYLLTQRDTHTKEGLLEVFTSSLEKDYIREEALVERIIREAGAIVATFEKEYLPSVGAGVVSERSITYRDPKQAHLSCYGEIDMIETLGDNAVRVTDFKTGSSKPKSKIEKLDDEGRMSALARQLAMYSYLLEHAEKGTSVEESRLLFLEEKPNDGDTLYTTKVGKDAIALLEKDIADYDTLVQNGTWIDRPCERETFGSREGCEYCAKAAQLYA